MKKGYLYRFLMLGLVLLAGVGKPDTFYWTNAAGGSFQDPLNWSPNQVPGSNDTAVFNLSNEYTVTWNGSITNHTYIVSAGTVKFDLQGSTVSLARESTNIIGLANSPVVLTLTNGTVQRLNPGYTGSFKETFFLRGSGTVLRLLNVNYDRVAYYPWIESDTMVIVSGSNAVFRTVGYSQRLQGTVIVTNGAYLDALAGFKPDSGGFVHVHGTGIGVRAVISFGGTVGIHSNGSVRFDGGAQVQNAAAQYQYFQGKVTLNNAYYYYYYGHPDYGWVYLDGPFALIEGTGTVAMSRIILRGGTIRVGETNMGGTLTFTGLITNATPGSGTIQIQLGGSTPPAHGQLQLISGVRGPGILYADGTHLQVTLIPGYQPTALTTFRIINAVSIVGTFNSITFPALPGQWITDDLYTKGEITYRPPPAGTLISIR